MRKPLVNSSLRHYTGTEESEGPLSKEECEARALERNGSTNPVRPHCLPDYYLETSVYMRFYFSVETHRTIAGEQAKKEKGHNARGTTL
jgi:hypothetical protein